MSHLTSNIDRTAFVSPTFADNENTHEFSTIQAAIDWAYSEYGVITDFAHPVIIEISTGYYEEQIHSYAGYYLVGIASGWDVPGSRPPITLYNTGADAAHWPLRSNDTDIYQLTGINIQTDADGTMGKLSAGFYNNCFFKYGHFIDATVAGNRYLRFVGCVFRNNTYGGFNLTGTTLLSYGWIDFVNCNLRGAPVFSSTHAGTTTIAFMDSFLNGHFTISGDWNFSTSIGGLHVFGEAVRNEFNTTGNVELYNGTYLNGLHFTSAPNLLRVVKTSFVGSEDNQIPTGEADITSDVVITADYLADINFHNGLCGNIRSVNPLKVVGGQSTGNRYLNIQEAINSIGISGTGVVELNCCFDSLAELTIPTGANVTIDGHKIYTLAFTGDVVELGASEQLVFYALSSLSGGNIEVNGNSAYVGFEEVLTANAYVTLTSGASSYCLVYNSTVKAPSGHPAILSNNADTTIVTGYSRIDGGIGHPAIRFTVGADNKLKVKFSTLLHGDGGVGEPIQYAGAGSMDIAIYSSALNASWDASDFHNAIGSANNTTDAQINF